MVRKKQFIDKKSAQHFHVVHRSQRDPKANDPEASKYVLLSSSQHVELRSDSESDDEYEDDGGDSELDSDDEMPDLVDTKSTKPKKKSSSSSGRAAFPVRKVRFGGVEAEDLVDENGLPRDGYDYSQHMKEMGQGKFYSATSRFDAGEEARALSRKVDLPEDALPSAEEQDRLLDAITLTTDVMDEDLREALVNDEAFEELDDNFVVQAAEQNADDAGTDDFDYDAHIAKLMEAASGVTPLYRGNLTDSEDEEFSDDEEEFSGGEAEPQEGETPDRDEEQRVLDELFEKTLAEEYDDDQLGELEEDDPETRGKETLDGELLAAVVEDYAFVQQELADAEGKLGNALRAGNRLKQVLEECEAERHAYEYDEDAETEDEEEPEDAAARAEREKKELQELFERNQYLQREEREQWDCETIVSTYSTLDNHPTVLREEGPTRRKKKKQPVIASIAEGVDIRKQKVTLSRKTGMPLGVFETEAAVKSKPAKHTEQQPETSRRQKGETKEQKRARKAAVKMEKMSRRAEKKETKLAFKEEEARQSTQTVAGRVSVFKY